MVLLQDMSESTEAPIQPETPPMAPPSPPEPTPEAIAEEEAEDSDGADWDAMDLDEITLPGQKSAKELAAEKVPYTAPKQFNSSLQSMWSGYVQTGYSWVLINLADVEARRMWHLMVRQGVSVW